MVHTEIGNPSPGGALGGWSGSRPPWSLEHSKVVPAKLSLYYPWSKSS